MILIDTSIWADHFNQAVPELSLLVARGEILQHPFVTGELGLGNPTDRKVMIAMLEALPQANVFPIDDLLDFAERHGLGGTGIGYVDAHLLASTHRHRTTLWTRDKRLMRQAERLGLVHISR